jgi:hypothetical protein
MREGQLPCEPQSTRIVRGFSFFHHPGLLAIGGPSVRLPIYQIIAGSRGKEVPSRGCEYRRGPALNSALKTREAVSGLPTSIAMSLERGLLRLLCQPCRPALRGPSDHLSQGRSRNTVSRPRGRTHISCRSPPRPNSFGHSLGFPLAGAFCRRDGYAPTTSACKPLSKVLRGPVGEPGER